MADDNDLFRRWWIFINARISTDYDDPKLRIDRYGYLIHYDAYGDRSSPLGWEIDHIVPVSRGGTDNLNNLQPLHWRANLAKAAN
jgi:hypothetical protein